MTWDTGSTAVIELMLPSTAHAAAEAGEDGVKLQIDAHTLICVRFP